MNKYFKLDEDDEKVSIVDSDFSDKAIAYMNENAIENCKEFLEDLERLRISEEVANPTVDECFNIIQNLMDIAEYVVGYEDPIVYFDKALNVMTDELQMAMDFNERHEYTWNMTTNFVTEDNANFWYAKEIIAGSLNKIFTRLLAKLTPNRPFLYRN